MSQTINYVTTVSLAPRTLVPVSPLPNVVEMLIRLVVALFSPRPKRPIRKMRRESRPLHFLKAISISLNYGYQAVNWNRVNWSPIS